MSDVLSPIIANRPGDHTSLEATLHAFSRGKQLDLDGCLPAIVISYDRTQNQATVKPLIKHIMMDDTQRSRFPITNVPVLALGGGGFFINFPLAAGDLGWIYATDRDITLFLQTLTEQAPDDGGALHSFENALFVPDVFRKYTINGADSGAMVISSLDSNTRISIKNGEIDIIAPTTVKITTPLAEFSAAVKINGNLAVIGTSTFTGSMAANGGFNGSGSSGTFVTLPSNTTINGVTVATHGHTQNGTSGRTSNGMIA